jgi:hypothetical protein
MRAVAALGLIVPTLRVQGHGVALPRGVAVHD